MSTINKITVIFHGQVKLELEDIQATILRNRPEPYFGAHVIVRIDDAAGGREFLRRLTPHVSSAAGSESQENAWIAVALSYPGLQALGLPDDSLKSFSTPLREGWPHARIDCKM